MTTESLVAKFNEFEQAISARYLERVRESRCVVLALVSGKHMFMVGHPGTAKTALIRDATKMISGLGDEGYFPWLMTKYTTPEEVFGPPSFAAMKEGKIIRITDHKLPRSRIAFLDEIFKASSSINNTLLTVLNERLFYNGDDDPEVPLSSLFAASNELPNEDEQLAAMWDRLLLRVEVESLRERSNFMTMLQMATNRAEPEEIVAWEEVVEAQSEVASVDMPEGVLEAMVGLRESLHSEGVEPSDRRWVECIPVIQAEAWMKGRNEANIKDLRILQHIMWDRTEEIHTVQSVILNVADPVEKQIVDLIRGLTALEEEFDKVVEDSDDERARSRVSAEIFNKLEAVREEILEISRGGQGRDIDLFPALKGRFRHVAARLVTEGFGLRKVENLVDLGD